DMSDEYPRLLGVLNVPEAHREIVASGEQPRAVAGNSCVLEIARVAAKGVQFLSTREIPELDALIEARGEAGAAIGKEFHHADVMIVRANALELITACD